MEIYKEDKIIEVKEELNSKKKQQLNDYYLSFESLKELNGNKFLLDEMFIEQKIESLNIK